MKLYKIKKSNVDKRGLYASKNIKTGTRIIQYKGRIIKKYESEENPKFDNNKRIYIFDLNKKYDLDGDYSYNTARLINHSCNPNCEVIGEGLRLWIEAIKDIKKGEELSYDYGFVFDENFKDHPCYCKSYNCCGYIVKQVSRWRIKKSLKSIKNFRKI